MSLSPVALVAAVILGTLTTIRAAACPAPAAALGVARVVEIDTAGGPIFGSLTSQARETRFLAPKEVVLTFDDGPMPGITSSILDTLDRFCTKATFFSVGRMAVAHPALVREVLGRGHTLGTHTWSHPMNLPRLSAERARDQIDSGFAAVALAASAPIAPFFRFPGLSDSPALLDHLQRRGIAAFTVDVVSNDSYIADPGRLVARTLQQTQAANGGILLFHDIKHVTARALPTILRELKVRGFSVVHLRAKTPHVPDERYVAAVRENMQRATRGNSPALLAVTAGLSASMHPAPAPLGIAGGTRTASVSEPPVTALAPAPRDRLMKARPVVGDTAAGAIQEQPVLAGSQPVTTKGALASRHRPERAAPDTPLDAWSAGWRRLQNTGG
jgi:peptidoglycan/xylan/chitin deacetylase (PgdA/CDA1 family)